MSVDLKPIIETEESTDKKKGHDNRKTTSKSDKIANLHQSNKQQQLKASLLSQALLMRQKQAESQYQFEEAFKIKLEIEEIAKQVLQTNIRKMKKSYNKKKKLIKVAKAQQLAELRFQYNQKCKQIQQYQNQILKKLKLKQEQQLRNLHLQIQEVQKNPQIHCGYLIVLRGAEKMLIKKELYEEAERVHTEIETYRQSLRLKTSRQIAVKQKNISECLKNSQQKQVRIVMHKIGRQRNSLKKVFRQQREQYHFDQLSINKVHKNILQILNNELCNKTNKVFKNFDLLKIKQSSQKSVEWICKNYKR